MGRRKVSYALFPKLRLLQVCKCLQLQLQTFATVTIIKLRKVELAANAIANTPTLHTAITNCPLNAIDARLRFITI